VKLHPGIAGSGVPLFAGEFNPLRLDLADTRVFDSGVMH
jgi:hypothetical protein